MARAAAEPFELENAPGAGGNFPLMGHDLTPFVLLTGNASEDFHIC